MTKQRWTLLLAATVAAGTMTAETPRAQSPIAPPATTPDSIGTARMEADGTIVLRLIAYDQSGARGEALMRYPPSHPQYAAILRHVGPLQPGEERPVAPWPD